MAGAWTEELTHQHRAAVLSVADMQHGRGHATRRVVSDDPLTVTGSKSRTEGYTCVVEDLRQVTFTLSHLHSHWQVTVTLASYIHTRHLHSHSAIYIHTSKLH